ncbi:MAG: molybdopterin-dependent oxidoreductase [Nitrospiraceae bacterium]
MTKKFSRRDLLRLAAGLVGTSVFPGPGMAVDGVFNQLFGSPPARLTSAITPNEDFYLTSYRSPPTVRLEGWELAVKGLVERPFTLTYAELLARPTVSEIVTLECVGNTVGGEFISTAEWAGISLKSVLGEAGMSSTAFDVVFRAADAYADSIPVERAMTGDVLIAHKMNGVPLPQGHGFPVRIIVPGIYGMKSVQWLTEIEVVDHDYLGYYQKKGWSDEAVVKTMSRIDIPGHGATVRGLNQVVRGLVFAGVRAIRQVEVSTDDGRTWNSATLDERLSPYSWRFWSYAWNVPKPGRYTLAVRATDQTGRLQSSFEQEPAPDGATGLHQVTVTVEL